MQLLYIFFENSTDTEVYVSYIDHILLVVHKIHNVQSFLRGIVLTGEHMCDNDNFIIQQIIVCLVLQCNKNILFPMYGNTLSK